MVKLDVGSVSFCRSQHLFKCFYQLREKIAKAFDVNPNKVSSVEDIYKLSLI